IIGRSFSASILGQYSLAYRVMLFPIQNITFVLTRSLYPILSRIQKNYIESVSIYLKTLKTIAIIIPPLMLGIAVVSRELVVVVFGPQWVHISSILIWLAPIAIMQSMVSTTGSVFMAQGKTGILLKISIYNAILQISSFIIGGFYSIDILIKLYLVANVLMFFPNMMLAMKVLNGSVFALVATIIKPIIAALLMSLVVIYFRSSVAYLELKPIALLTFSVLVGVVTYSFMMLVIERKYIAGFFKNR
ncbi:oligosaccharide flippase family protein, partial [Serratia fonticola]|nr:oligosaccharide flippase family protein [Serratia fonticola]